METEQRFWSIISTIFLVVILVNAKDLTSHHVNCPLKSRNIHLDLEGSETSYGFPQISNYGLSYEPFAYTTNPTSNTRYTVNSELFGTGQNLTSIHQQIRCGDTFPRSCDNSQYRSYDGSCNNLRNPTWGMANTRYGRLLPSNYGDGIRSPTNSITGAALPPPRLVSYTLFPNVDIDDPIWTLAAMQWGQIITHDMAMIDGTTQSKKHATQCCTDDGRLVDPSLLHGHCYPIIVPRGDPVYSVANIECLNFVRSTTDLDRDCSSQLKPAEQLTVVTHFLDLSLVYGSSEQVATSLRAGVGGRLNVDIRHNKEWPPAAANKSGVCDTTLPHEICYQTGDSRANQNPQLTVLQIILLREHNRVAGALARLNPHWTDETIFQEARKIAIAEHQHISYYEWLPIFLGMQGTYGNKILYNTKGYVNDYNPTVNPSVLNEHSNAAFRYFHSLIAGFLNENWISVQKAEHLWRLVSFLFIDMARVEAWTVDKLNKGSKRKRKRSESQSDRKETYDLVNEYRLTGNSLRLSDHLNRPGIIEEFDNMDGLTRGMAYQAEKASDQYFDAEITEFLFRNERPLGSDLRATDIQRNRDHGLASYNDFREYCGLPRAKYFTDFKDYISVANVRKLSQLYASPDDVELTVGGALENHVPGTLSGPTFLCILIRQFYRTRVSDRYWYERGDQDSAFTLEQLAEIRKASISRLFCDNGDRITNMQLRGFQKVSRINPITSCDSIPSVDLSLWKDFAPQITEYPDEEFPYYK